MREDITRAEFLKKVSAASAALAAASSSLKALTAGALAGPTVTTSAKALKEEELPSEEAVLAKMRHVNDMLAGRKAPIRLEKLQLFNLRGGPAKYQLHQAPCRLVMGDWWRYCNFDYKALTCNPDGDPVNNWDGEKFIAQWTPESYEMYKLYSGKKITYMVDPTFGNAKGSKRYPDRWPALTSADTEAAIDRAMATWGMALAKYEIEIVKMPYDGEDHASIACWLAKDPEKCECGPYGNQKEIPQNISFPANVVFNGWRPDGLIAEIMGTLLNGITGVAMGYVWCNPDGSTTDMNFDNYMDDAVTEIYFKRDFQYQEETFQGDICWGIDATYDDMWREIDNVPYTVVVDVEAVALHEAGHGLDLQDYSGTGVPGRNGIMSYNLDVSNSRVLQPQDIAGLNAVFESWHTKHCQVPLPTQFGPVTITQPQKKI